MSLNIGNIYKEVVENIFNRWTALKLAVENGLGGRNGHQTAIDIVTYITDYCLKNDSLIPSEVEEVMEEIMDQEFDTICEDGSIKEISILLIKYLNMCKAGQLSEIESDFSKMPMMTKWLYPGAKITYTAAESSDSDEDMDEPIGPSTSGSTTEMIEEDIDPEWTVVKTRRKK